MKNMMHRTGVAGAVLLALGMASAPAAAATPGFYVAADLANSTYDVNRSDLDEDFETVQSSLDKTGLGYSFAVGYQFSPFFAVEAAYADLGKAKYSASVDDGEDAFDLTATFKVGGPALSLVGSWPLTDTFSLDARAGALFGKTKLTGRIDGVPGSFSESENDTSLLFGVGGTYSFSDTLGIRLGYTILKDALAGEENVNQFSVGLKYSFGR